MMMDIKDIKLGDILKPFISPASLAYKGEGCVSPNHPALNGFVGTVIGFGPDHYDCQYVRLRGEVNLPKDHGLSDSQIQEMRAGILFNPTYLVKV